MTAEYDKSLQLTKIENAMLMKGANQLPTIGLLERSSDGLIYLNIEDGYIHNLLPLIRVPNIQKPDYFGDKGIGAHISVIYPYELASTPSIKLNDVHRFSLTGFFSAQLKEKKYFLLGVLAPSLAAIRSQNGLPKELLIKEHWVNFHITVGCLAITPNSFK